MIFALSCGRSSLTGGNKLVKCLFVVKMKNKCRLVQQSSYWKTKTTVNFSFARLPSVLQKKAKIDNRNTKKNTRRLKPSQFISFDYIHLIYKSCMLRGQVMSKATNVTLIDHSLILGIELKLACTRGLSGGIFSH